jgi:cytidyltransferase-like protein
MTTALTIGTFDTPHLGHGYLFRFCSQIADRVVIGVNTDRFVKEYKKFPPLYRTAERVSIIAQLGYEVVENDSAGRETIERVSPDLLVIGSDWLRRDYLTQVDMTVDDLERLRCALVFTPNIEGISSTGIKARART